MNLIKREDPFENLAKKFFGSDDFFTFTPRVFMGENSNVGKTNIIDNEKEYILELSIPGFKKEDIDIKIEDDVLTISSNFEEEKNDNYYKKEFVKSSFSRSFYVPEDVTSKIDAKMEDGILTVIFTKREVKKKDSKVNIEIK